MNKFKRNERIGAIVKILSDNPNKIFTLSFFTNQFNAAKSTISYNYLRSSWRSKVYTKDIKGRK